VEEARRSAGEIPAARFVELADCGHSPMEECPDQFLGAVTPFLREIDGGRRLARRT
jgi:pimeloyl-ACP methyl ester carboxylesterase